MYKGCGGITLAPLLGCVWFPNSDAQKETGAERSWWERRQDADLFTGREEGGILFQVGEGGEEKDWKEPLDFRSPGDEVRSGGKLGFSEGEVRPPRTDSVRWPHLLTAFLPLSTDSRPWSGAGDLSDFSLLLFYQLRWAGREEVQGQFLKPHESKIAMASFLPPLNLSSDIKFTGFYQPSRFLIEP